MKKSIKRYVVSWLLLAGMICSPMITGVGSIATYAAEATEQIVTAVQTDNTDGDTSDGDTTDGDINGDDTTDGDANGDDTTVGDTSGGDTTDGDTSGDDTTGDNTTGNDADEDTPTQVTQDGVEVLDVISTNYGGDLEEVVGYQISDSSLLTDEITEINVQTAMQFNAAPATSYSSTRAYDQIGSSLQSAYTALSNAAIAFDNTSTSASLQEYTGGSAYVGFNVTVSQTGLSSAEMFKVYLAVRYDNPQLFWMDGKVLFTSTNIYACVANNYISFLYQRQANAPSLQLSEMTKLLAIQPILLLQ